MTVQVNVRLDEVVVEQIDGWAKLHRVSRPELVREVLTEWLNDRENERIADAYRRGYAEHPETDDELRQAETNAKRLVADEPWEKWW